MRLRERVEIQRGQGYDIRVIGVPDAGLRDIYHWFLRIPWWAALAAIVAGYLVLNALFATAYLAGGGIANAAAGSWLDAFFFSVQTMGTIGYGSMYPATRLANVLVVAESVTGLVVTALATGLVFARFSQARPRVVFSSRIAVGPLDGVPALTVRLGNERRGRIVDAAFRLTITRTTRTAEGVSMYRTVDLPLLRHRATALSRSWTVVHRIVDGSPLAGDTPESLAAAEAEVTLAVTGTDETSMQAVHAQHTWTHGALAWGTRLADVLSETPDGDVVLDLRRFHEVVATAPIAGFPWGAGAGGPPAPPGPALR